MSLLEVPKFLHKLNSNLQENWIAGRFFYQYSNTINTLQWQICCLNSNAFFFVIRNVKRKRIGSAKRAIK